MITLLLIILFTTCFTFVTWHRFYLGLGVLFFFLPAYLLRFKIGLLPGTMLEIMILIVLLVGLLQFKEDIIFQIHKLKSKLVWLFLGIVIFLLAATISVFTSVDLRSAAGEWKAFYIEPFLLFFLLTAVLKEKKQFHFILFSIILSGLVTTGLAIYQHFTGWMVPWDFWQNGNSFRVTAWYGFPNGVGLYLAPLIPLAIYFSIKAEHWFYKAISLLLILAGPLAIVYAKSTGALIGLLGGLGVLLLIWKKTRWWAIVVGAISLIALILIPTDNTFKQELLLQDRSGQIRMTMWEETIELLKDRPIFGAGLASYQHRIVPFHTTLDGEGIEIFEHPHNIILTMYTNLGLLGLLGFVWMVVWFYKFSIDLLKPKIITLTPFLISSMTVILIHGLVDSPYIKNDLAVMFWLLFALVIISNNPKTIKFR